MNHLSRRNFLRDSGSLVGGSWLGLSLPAVLAIGQVACARKDAGEAWQNLSEDEAAGFAAIADQIIPPDETPGAAGTGVLYFLDEALNGFMQGAGPRLKEGLRLLDEKTAENHPGRNVFADLEFDDQKVLLESEEDSPMFQTMLVITRMGMFALPEYGGNRDNAGWKLIGFEHQHAWQAPFGHYDREHAEQGESRDES